MDEEDERRTLIIFGRDISTIPCFRSSLLYGLGTGIAGGLGTFMFTSKPRLATHMSMATFVGSTWCYWMYCRYNWAQQEIEAAKLKVVIERHAVLRGTPKETEINEPTKLPLVEA